MTPFKFEYIWLDGYQPEANLRSKTKILHFENFVEDVKKIPDWSFDGSSTQQAPGNKSDCILKPVSIYKDPARLNAYLVLCEVMNVDGTPHPTNTRALIPKGFDDYWFGFEQEYTLMDGTRPLGFPEQGFPNPQGRYYCSVGNKNVAGREIVEAHLDLCLEESIISEKKTLISFSVAEAFWQRSPLIQISEQIKNFLGSSSPALFYNNRKNDSINIFMNKMDNFKFKNQGYFFLIHHMMPHKPYVFHSDCSTKKNLSLVDKKKLLYLNKRLKNKTLEARDYKENYECMLKRVNQFASFINKNDPEANIIITGEK